MTKLLRLSGIVVVSSVFLAGIAFAAGSNGESEKEQEKLLYFMGTQLGQSLMLLQLSDAELDQVLLGARDTVQGKAMKLDPTVFGPKLAKFGEERQKIRL
jgi:hypothetical protein